MQKNIYEKKNNTCPKCKQGELEIHSGRFICFDCGYSRMIKEDKYEKNKKNTDK
jgi:ribosomal protein S27AE